MRLPTQTRPTTAHHVSLRFLILLASAITIILTFP